MMSVKAILMGSALMALSCAAAVGATWIHHPDPGSEGAGVRRAHRDRGLIESWREKPAIRRCISWQVTTVPELGDVGRVYLDDRLLFEVSGQAGGYTVARRTELIAARLERLLEMKAALEPVAVERWGDEWVVTLEGSLVVTAATGLAARYRMSRRALAERWADSLRTALHAAIGPGAQVVRGNPPAEPIRITQPPWDDRYYGIIKGDRSLERGDVEAAIVWYRRAVREDPSGYDARWKLGKALAAAGRLQDAHDELVACLQIRPQFWPARRELGLVERRLRDGDS